MDASAIHKTDIGLLYGLSQLIPRESSIVDFGCGDATYAQVLSKLGHEVEAYDGNPNVEELTSDFGQVQDLSKPFDLGKKFDFVLSFEVGEHIPEIFESTYIENLVKHCNSHLIISWAIPHQQGHGHVNELLNEEVIKKIQAHGFNFNSSCSKFLRMRTELKWFKNTILCFDQMDVEKLKSPNLNLIAQLLKRTITW